MPWGADLLTLCQSVGTAGLDTALAGAAIGVQPFDQPDVAAAKAATNEVLQEGGAAVATTPLAELLAQVRPGDHLAIQAFGDTDVPQVGRLQDARLAPPPALPSAVTPGFGPRFLPPPGP